MKQIQLFVVLLFFPLIALSQKPAWIGNTPHEKNNTYKFVEIISYGSDISSAQSEAIKKLAQNEQLIKTVEVNVSTHKDRTINQEVINGAFNENINDITYVNLDINGKKMHLQANIIDEWGGMNDGIYELHTLFQVATSTNPVFDRTYLTTSYGATPVVMSIIPGLGQWYKGSKVKGICMFGAEAVAVAGIIFTDNQRASYVKKAKEHPKFAVQYGNKADSWETGRNICIGVAAGIWIYNIVDAIVAKGARRVVVNHADGRGLSVAPYLDFDGAAGVSLAYKF